MESNYTRKDTNRKYISGDLTINKMYTLYREDQQNKGKRAVKTKVYRTIFCQEYNLAFHKPKKKSKDKLRSQTDSSFVVATFDMEAVLPTPCSNVSQVYYKRKLSCYKYSVYSLGDGKGYCYLLNESEGQRGSCEIGTCLGMYIKSMPPSVKHGCLFFRYILRTK